MDQVKRCYGQWLLNEHGDVIIHRQSTKEMTRIDFPWIFIVFPSILILQTEKRYSLFFAAIFESTAISIKSRDLQTQAQGSGLRSSPKKLLSIYH